VVIVIIKNESRNGIAINNETLLMASKQQLL